MHELETLLVVAQLCSRRHRDKRRANVNDTSPKTEVSCNSGAKCDDTGRSRERNRERVCHHPDIDCSTITIVGRSLESQKVCGDDWMGESPPTHSNASLLHVNDSFKSQQA